jgi:hypothetical protein
LLPSDLTGKGSVIFLYSAKHAFPFYFSFGIEVIDPPTKDTQPPPHGLDIVTTEPFFS